MIYPVFQPVVFLRDGKTIGFEAKVLYDEIFKAGFTKEYTRRYGIDADWIVIEVTER